MCVQGISFQFIPFKYLFIFYYKKISVRPKLVFRTETETETEFRFLSQFRPKPKLKPKLPFMIIP